MSRPKTLGDKPHRLTILLPDEQYRLLSAKAAANHETTSEFLRRIIREYLAKSDA